MSSILSTWMAFQESTGATQDSVEQVQGAYYAGAASVLALLLHSEDTQETFNAAVKECQMFADDALPQLH